MAAESPLQNTRFSWTFDGEGNFSKWLKEVLSGAHPCGESFVGYLKTREFYGKFVGHLKSND
jgi:hypothetical protein